MKRTIALIFLIFSVAGCSKSAPESLEQIGKGTIKINDPSFAAPQDTMTIDIDSERLVGFLLEADSMLGIICKTPVPRPEASSGIA